MSVNRSPSSKASSTPVTVTVCGVAQFKDVNVSSAGAVEISVGSPLLTIRTTLEAGWAVSTIVKSSEVPASRTDVPPSVWVMTKPAWSSSTVVTETT